MTERSRDRASLQQTEKAEATPAGEAVACDGNSSAACRHPIVWGHSQYWAADRPAPPFITTITLLSAAVYSKYAVVKLLTKLIKKKATAAPIHHTRRQ